MHSFFVESENINNGTARISGSDAKHLKTVMRLGIGDEIRLIDGKGFDYLACIDAYDGADVLAKIIECKKSSAEPTRDTKNRYSISSTYEITVEEL